MQKEMDRLLSIFAQHKIVPVIELESVEDALPLGNTLLDSGLPVAEITLRTSAALPSITLLAEKLPELTLIAGTVINPQMAQYAMSAGAQMVVSPGYNPSTADYCCESDIPIMPGVMTPGEIERALMLGIRAVKFFPAQAAGGVKMLQALMGPYKDIQFMPTGGISPDNINDYLALPQVCCCGGSWMVPSTLIVQQQWNEIAARIKAAVSLVSGQ